MQKKTSKKDGETQSPLQKLGTLIRKERKSQKLSQLELAHLSKCSINFVSQVEFGKKTAQISKVLALINTLGLQFKVELGKDILEISDKLK